MEGGAICFSSFGFGNEIQTAGAQLEKVPGHCLSHISHLLVQQCLSVRKFIGNRIGNTFRKEGRRVKLQESLFDHPAHQVGHIRHVDSVPEASIEAVSIEQSHEKLKVRFLSIMWRSSHQQKMTRNGGKQLTELVPFCILHLAAEDTGGHLVSLVAHNQVPTAVGSLELLLNILVAQELVQPGND